VNILIIGPALLSKARGNRTTALRWGGILTELGHEVVFDNEYCGQDCDLLIALHAISSRPSVGAFREAHPQRPIVLVLTGTDVYGFGSMFDEAGRAAAEESMELAARLVAFHPLAIDEIPAHLRDKVSVIYQSAMPVPTDPRRDDTCDVAVVGELREVKDPFRAALAARRLPPTSMVRVLHGGAAGSAELAARAAKEEQANSRYSWLGEISSGEALALIGRSHLLAISSKHEGGPNVLAEALAFGTPVVVSRIPGTIGVVGTDYPGCFEPEDSDGLADLIARAESDPEFYESLRQRCVELAELASPSREVDSWKELLESL
jgi:putative glycosyltransferase (TIGR04348 family)